jgi:hypothetical protein
MIIEDKICINAFNIEILATQESGKGNFSESGPLELLL